MALLIAAEGLRRPWAGARPVIWWRNQRVHRSVYRVWFHLARVLAATLLLLVASVLVTTAVAALIVAGLVAAVLLIAWFFATRVAIKAEPPTTPLEDGRAVFIAELGDSPFDRRVVDGDVDLAPDPSVPVRRPEHNRAEIDI